MRCTKFNKDIQDQFLDYTCLDRANRGCIHYIKDKTVFCEQLDRNNGSKSVK